MSRTHDECIYCGDPTIGHCMVNSCMYAEACKKVANLKQENEKLKEDNERLRKAVSSEFDRLDLKNKKMLTRGQIDELIINSTGKTK